MRDKRKNLISRTNLRGIIIMFVSGVLLVSGLLFGSRTTAQIHHNTIPKSTPHATATPNLNSSQSDKDVSIVVDGKIRYQTIEGFGATTLALGYGGADAAGYDGMDNLTPDLRMRAIEALYGQVKLTMGNLDFHLTHANENKFDFRDVSLMWEKVVKLGNKYGFDNYSLSPKIDFRYMPWLADLRSSDYEAYLEACAAHVVAVSLEWKRLTGSVPPTLFLFNEPLSGNGELKGGNEQEIVDITKRCGMRLRQAGLEAKFVLPNEETEEKTLSTAKFVLADAQARQYVAAIGYHPYPYGSAYAFIPNILATSGSGNPVHSRIAIRQKLRDLGRKYNIPVWMTEVSHGGVPLESMDALRGRAIHIHDELLYAEASAYFGMNAMWDSKTHQEHTKGTRPLDSETDTVVLVDNKASKISITGLGYAIGHYARWVERGAQRIEAAGNDPLVLVTAFADDKSRRVTLVVINNTDASRRVNFAMSNLPNLKKLNVEQSSGMERWQKLSSVAVVSNKAILMLPSQSVTTLVGQL